MRLNCIFLRCQFLIEGMISYQNVSSSIESSFQVFNAKFRYDFNA